MKIRSLLPSHLTDIHKLMPELVSIMEQGIEDKVYAFAWLEETLSRSASVQRTEQSSSSTDRGIVLRITAGGCNHECALDEFEPQLLKTKAAQLRKKVIERGIEGGKVYTPKKWAEENLTDLPDDLRLQISGVPQDKSHVHFGAACLGENPLSISLSDLGRRAKALREEAMRRDKIWTEKYVSEPLASVSVSFRLRIIQHIFVDRYKNLSQSLPVFLCVISSQSAKGKGSRIYTGGLGGSETLMITEDDWREVIDIPHRLESAERLTPGNWSVITGPDVTGVLAHEAFGHTQESDTCLQGRSISTDLRRQNIKVGGDDATIVNDPGLFAMDGKSFGTNGSYYFDHEGELARKQIILDKGSLCAPMTDLLSSLYLNEKRSANGKRESWRRPVLSRQTNTYFESGDKSVEELIASVKGRAFLAAVSHGGMEDPKGANLTAGAEYFEEIVDGKLTGRLFTGPRGGHIELSGYVPDLLSAIVGRSKSNGAPENKLGGCGKYHKELVSAGCGGPWIHWDKIICG